MRQVIQFGGSFLGQHRLCFLKYGDKGILDVWDDLSQHKFIGQQSGLGSGGRRRGSQRPN